MNRFPFPDEDALTRALLSMRPRILCYGAIMETFPHTNVITDPAFQRLFNGFYRLRRNQAFRQVYFRYMEENKGCACLEFDQVLMFLHKECNRVEPSFSSKLLATVNPEKPVWDSLVLCHLGLEPPAAYRPSEIRLPACVGLYHQIENWYQDFLPTAQCDQVVAVFDACYPHLPITRLKKIDLALWSVR